MTDHTRPTSGPRIKLEPADSRASLGMATMAQPTPQQQRDSNLTPLQILPAMLHAVFCQTADVFNAPSRQQPRAVIYTNAQIRTSVSVCNERFQYALDLLEMDILKAKATLRRDLSKLRALAAAEAAAEAAEAAQKLALEEATRARLEEATRARLEAATRAQEAALRREEEEEAARAEAERARLDIIMQDAPPSPPPPPPPPIAVVAPAAVAPLLLAPPAPMAPPGNFDDFLASLPVGVDGGMGGGQPLEDADLFGNEFNDLFGYGGT